MSEQENAYQQIENYLSGQMSGQDKEVFENLLKVDLDLNQTLEAYKIAQKILIGNELMTVKALMQSDFDKGIANVIGSNPVFKYLAAGLAILSIALFWWFNQESKNAESLNKKTNSQTIEIDSSINRNEIQTVPQDSGFTEKVLGNQKTEKIEKSNTLHEKTTINTCKDTIISFSCQARAACEQQFNGAIEIDISTIKTGKSPLVFSTNINGDYTNKPIIEHLKTGRYKLYVKDANNCIRTLNITIEVPRVDCEN